MYSDLLGVSSYRHNTTTSSVPCEISYENMCSLEGTTPLQSLSEKGKPRQVHGLAFRARASFIDIDATCAAGYHGLDPEGSRRSRNEDVEGTSPMNHLSDDGLYRDALLL